MKITFKIKELISLNSTSYYNFNYYRLPFIVGNSAVILEECNEEYQQFYYYLIVEEKQLLFFQESVPLGGSYDFDIVMEIKDGKVVLQERWT